MVSYLYYFQSLIIAFGFVANRKEVMRLGDFFFSFAYLILCSISRYVLPRLKALISALHIIFRT